MGNKIEPTKTDNCVPATSILDLMKIYVDSKLCYHSDPMKTAEFIDQHDRFAYQIDLWTLIDKRKFKKCERPYNGEPSPNENLRGLFDYEYELPDTVLKRSKHEYHNLEQTRQKTACFSCGGEGIKTCRSCDGQGHSRCWLCSGTGNGGTTSDNVPISCLFCSGKGYTDCSKCGKTGKIHCRHCGACGYLLIWWKLEINWFTIHSVSYQTNTPMPPRKILKAPTKEDYLIYNEKWSYFDTFHGQFEADFAKQSNRLYPVKVDELAKEFNKKHLNITRKDRRIAKLKWNIQILKIAEVVYELEGYTNEHMKDLSHRFRFYYYGQDKKNRPLIYENDYPLNACGCFGVGCAHRSMCCTIS
ncbi:unnamed protein product [Rotaria magnacalcarata]|uniref:Uncharacterized protein n=1 Tax=Rotaria magnacalcarata TaxID=392030 RepID=A0A820ERE5_9BILA|nr:unnamed protein product [Rotaria magnacalcarata]CAF2161362.1 unnamed protein product [Rotaria magnacalcarata]CAF4200741.1 unnamed protein product [Rotaria magnacalcarata]CAF4250313.1 unnamed protein product [Rotaria magnacalcarata]